MPVRFQVDPDFYDHPKSIHLSDAAVALWTRAGSYSAGKLTDGVIPDSVLPRLSQTPDTAAAELVAAGLWRRGRRCHRFHQWEHRNLTKKRVEADRQADRDRKARNRTSTPNAQVIGGDVRGGIRAESGPESERIPDDSVSVSVSVSSSSTQVGSDLTQVADEPRSRPVSMTARKIARAYTDKVKLADIGKVCAIVTNATGAGYSAEQISAALSRLADDKRSVTADTLRIEIEGKRLPDGAYRDDNGVLRLASGQPIAGKGWQE